MLLRSEWAELSVDQHNGVIDVDESRLNMARRSITMSTYAAVSTENN